jgi:uncharacterized protein (DUF3084 family)
MDKSRLTPREQIQDLKECLEVAEASLMYWSIEADADRYETKHATQLRRANDATDLLSKIERDHINAPNKMIWFQNQISGIKTRIKSLTHGKQLDALARYAKIIAELKADGITEEMLAGLREES